MAVIVIVMSSFVCLLFFVKLGFMVLFNGYAQYCFKNTTSQSPNNHLINL
jgi:hypothetical protein